MIAPLPVNAEFGTGVLNLASVTAPSFIFAVVTAESAIFAVDTVPVSYTHLTLPTKA